MVDKGKRPAEVDKSLQTASERTSLTITMPPRRESFPDFSQTEANEMQTEEDAVSVRFAKTPPQEFANFNRQVNANGSEVDESLKQLSEKAKGKRRAIEIMSSTSTHGNTPKAKPFTRSKNSFREIVRTRFPFEGYWHCSTKDIDNDNIQTDDEDGNKDGDKNGGLDGNQNRDKDEPCESLRKRIFQFDFRGRKDTKIDKSHVVEFHDPSASGNILGAESNSGDPAATSHLNGMNSYNVRGIREERSPNEGTESSTSENDVPANKGAESLSEGPEVIHQGAIVPDPNFNTQIEYSSETPAKILRVEPATETINIIHNMCKDPSEKPKMPTPMSIREEVSSRAGRLNIFKKWSESGKANQARMILRYSEVDQGTSTRDRFRYNAQRGVVNDHTNSTEDLRYQINRTAKNCRTRGLEAPISQISYGVSSVRTCFISKSNSVKSIAPIIENASNEAGGDNAAPESAQRLQDTSNGTSLRRRARVDRLRERFASSIEEVINSNETPDLMSDVERTTLRRTPRVNRVKREFTDSIDEVINSNETPNLMSDVDIQGSSPLSGLLDTITRSNFIGSSNGVIQSQKTPALMSGVADDSIEDEDEDEGAPLCRQSSRDPSASEARDTESEMNGDQRQNALAISRATSRNWRSSTRVDQLNDHDTSTTVAPGPEELQEPRFIEDYKSLMVAINENCAPEGRRALNVLRQYQTKMATILESDPENDSEASQRSNSDPPSLTDTTNTSESSTSVQQQSPLGVFRSNAFRRKHRSMRFESHNDELAEWETQGHDRDNASENSRRSSLRRILGMGRLSR
ncbi:hypothetical protein EAE96_007874 [Botrytis aclada]|nr:hypothetical protein EAE96_007874 [Botrytis aclada]